MTAQLATGTLFALLLAVIRTVAWLVVCPPFNGRVLPVTTKAMLAVAIVLPLVPRLAPNVPPADSWSMVVSAGEQVIVGAGLGFLTAIVFAGIQAAGDLLDVFGGFSLAFSYDPMSFAGNDSVFGRFYGLLATTLLFATDGHLLVIRGFTLSFDAVPVNQTLSLAALSRLLTTGLVQMFLSALQIAGPLIVVLFLADVGLGLLNRIAPALNAFSLGFPAKIALLLSTAGLAIGLLPEAVQSITDNATNAVLQVIGR